MKYYLNYDEAESLLPNGDDIHTFIKASFGLISADWRREDILRKLNEADIVIELTGEQAKLTKHGMCAYNKNAKSQSDILFIETDEEKLTAFEQTHSTENGGEQKMREILFRGKTYDGKWEQGDLRHGGYVHNDSETYITRSDYALHNIPVDAKTVGQFTGLTDKNGKKIFEGDILRIARKSDGTGRYYIPPLNYPVNVVVKWDMCAWMWETICDDKRYICFPEAWCHYECEVIGNIHDNPELMKGE